MTFRAVVLLALASGPAAAELSSDMWTYTCDRGAIIHATYVDDGTSGLVVLSLEGQQVALPVEGPISEDGASFALPQPSYLWATSGMDARLFWRDGGQDTPLLTCRTAF